MQTPKDVVVLRWACFALSVAALVWAAHMFRWVAMPGGPRVGSLAPPAL